MLPLSLLALGKLQPVPAKAAGKHLDGDLGGSALGLPLARVGGAAVALLDGGQVGQGRGAEIPLQAWV